MIVHHMVSVWTKNVFVTLHILGTIVQETVWLVLICAPTMVFVSTAIVNVHQGILGPIVMIPFSSSLVPRAKRQFMEHLLAAALTIARVMVFAHLGNAFVLWSFLVWIVLYQHHAPALMMGKYVLVTARVQMAFVLVLLVGEGPLVLSTLQSRPPSAVLIMSAQIMEHALMVAVPASKGGLGNLA